MQAKKIKATSIVEITISLVIISICMGIASHFFIQIDQQLKTPNQLKDENAYQNWLIENYALDSIQGERNLELENFTLNKTQNRTKEMIRHEYSIKNAVSEKMKHESYHPTNYHEN